MLVGFVNLGDRGVVDSMEPGGTMLIHSKVRPNTCKERKHRSGRLGSLRGFRWSSEWARPRSSAWGPTVRSRRPSTSQPPQGLASGGGFA